MMKKALSASQSMVRFLIDGEYGGDLGAMVLAGLKKDTIEEDVITDVEDHVGWVPFEDPYTESFVGAQIRYGDMFAFCLRIDRRTVPAKVLEQRMSRRMKERKEETGRDFLSRNEIAEMKEIVFEALLRKTPYTPKVFEVVWDIERRVVFCFSTEKAGLEALQNLFFKSFNLKLMPAIPFIQAVHDLDAAGEERVKTLTPTHTGA